MDSIFTYIPSIYCIRNTHFTPFILTSGLSHIPKIHKSILTKCYNDGVLATMIYHNEIIITRDLANINDNEIQQFVLTNPKWDILILGVNSIENVVPLSGYKNITQLDINKSLSWI